MKKNQTGKTPDQKELERKNTNDYALQQEEIILKIFGIIEYLKTNGRLQVNYNTDNLNELIISFKIIDRAIKIIKTLNALTDNIDKYNAYIPNETLTKKQQDDISDALVRCKELLEETHDTLNEYGIFEISSKLSNELTNLRNTYIEPIAEHDKPKIVVIDQLLLAFKDLETTISALAEKNKIMEQKKVDVTTEKSQILNELIANLEDFITLVPEKLYEREKIAKLLNIYKIDTKNNTNGLGDQAHSLLDNIDKLTKENNKLLTELVKLDSHIQDNNKILNELERSANETKKENGVTFKDDIKVHKYYPNKHQTNKPSNASKIKSFLNLIGSNKGEGKVAPLPSSTEGDFSNIGEEGKKSSKKQTEKGLSGTSKKSLSGFLNKLLHRRETGTYKIYPLY